MKRLLYEAVALLLLSQRRPTWGNLDAMLNRVCYMEDMFNASASLLIGVREHPGRLDQCTNCNVLIVG